MSLTYTNKDIQQKSLMLKKSEQKYLNENKSSIDTYYNGLTFKFFVDFSSNRIRISTT